ncbi:hypothetical protein KAJ41_03240 [Candidatus Parcubacteria bacterium]|nr:hypothetical protein [Candidatus Parcubacteria bacterium]
MITNKQISISMQHTYAALLAGERNPATELTDTARELTAKERGVIVQMHVMVSKGIDGISYLVRESFPNEHAFYDGVENDNKILRALLGEEQQDKNKFYFLDPPKKDLEKKFVRKITRKERKAFSKRGQDVPNYYKIYDDEKWIGFVDCVFRKVSLVTDPRGTKKLLLILKELQK